MAILKTPTGTRLNLVRTPEQPAKPFRPPNRPAEVPPSMGREWAAICRNLHEAGLWHDDRVPLIAAYMFNVHLARQAGEVLIAEGPMLDDKPHPALRIRQQAETGMVTAAKALGLAVTAANAMRRAEPGDTGAGSGKGSGKGAAPVSAWERAAQ